MRRHVVYCIFFCVFFLSVTRATKSNNFGSRYLGEGSSEEDKIFQVARAGVDVHDDPDWQPLVKRVPMGNQNIEGCKEFCDGFLQAGLTDLDEIWHDGGS